MNIVLISCIPPLRKKLKRSKSPSADEPKKKKQRKAGVKVSGENSKDNVPQGYKSLIRKGTKLGRFAGGSVKAVNNAFKNPKESKIRKRIVIEEESEEEEEIVSEVESEFEIEDDSKKDEVEEESKSEDSDDESNEEDEESDDSFCNDAIANGHTIVNVGHDAQVNYNQKVKALLKQHCTQCDKHQISTSIFNFMKMRKLPSYHQPKSKFDFMCLHNKCGKLDPSDCTFDLMTCCHHSFSIISGSKMAYKEIIKCAFTRNKGGALGDYVVPTLKMKWDKFVKFACPYTPTGTNFRNFRNNTIIRHLKGEHKHKGVPVSIEPNFNKRQALITAKKGKDISYNTYVDDSESPLCDMSLDDQKIFYKSM